MSKMTINSNHIVTSGTSLLKHVVIQIMWIAFVVYSDAMILIFNSGLERVGIDYRDSHIYLGVYVYAACLIVLPIAYALYLIFGNDALLQGRASGWSLRAEAAILIALSWIAFFWDLGKL